MLQRYSEYEEIIDLFPNGEPIPLERIPSSLIIQDSEVCWQNLQNQISMNHNAFPRYTVGEILPFLIDEVDTIFIDDKQGFYRMLAELPTYTKPFLFSFQV